MQNTGELRHSPTLPLRHPLLDQHNNLPRHFKKTYVLVRLGSLGSPCLLDIRWIAAAVPKRVEEAKKIVMAVI